MKKYLYQVCSILEFGILIMKQLSYTPLFLFMPHVYNRHPCYCLPNQFHISAVCDKYKIGQKNKRRMSLVCNSMICNTFCMLNDNITGETHRCIQMRHMLFEVLWSYNFLVSMYLIHHWLTNSLLMLFEPTKFFNYIFMCIYIQVHYMSSSIYLSYFTCMNSRVIL